MAERVGVDYESNPAAFLAATRQVMDSSAEAMKSFDLNDRALKRLAVSYLSTSDAAKQASVIQRMAAIQVANDMAAASARQVEAQRVVQAATVATAATTRAAADEVSRSGRLIDAALRPDSIRSFRSELKEFAHDAGGLRAATGGLALLGAGFIATAVGAPLVSAAFTAAQSAVEKFGKSLFSSGEEIRKVQDQADKLAAQSNKDFASMLATVHSVAEASGLLSTSIKDATAQVDFSTITDKLHNALAAQGADTGVITQRMKAALAEVAQAEADLAKNGGEITPSVTAAKDALNALAKSGDISAKSLASINYAFDVADKNKAVYEHQSATVQQLAKDLHLTTEQVYGLNFGILDLKNATSADVQQFEMFSGAAQAAAITLSGTTASTYGLTSAVEGLLNVLGQAGHGSITAGFSTIVGDVVKDAGILANNPLLRLTQSDLQKKGLNPDQISSFLSQQKTTLSAIGSGGVSSVGGQAGLYDLNNIINPVSGGGGGGGASYSAAQAAKDSQSDALANLRARISAEQQIHPSSLAYEKQVETAAKDTLASARAAEKHAQAVVQHANGEKARHAALQALHATQNLVNAAQKDVTRLQDEGKAITLAAAKSALELRNAKLEATSNMRDQATADAVAVTEAKAALDLDKKGTLAYYQDLKTFNEAVATAAQDAASAADQAKQDQISLANAMIQSNIDYSNPLSALQAAVKEAQNTLGGDTAGTTQFYLDTAALNQANQQLKDALAQNTQATATNTAAMTGVMPGGQEPGYIALRGANGSAFLPARTSAGGAGGGVMNVTVNLTGSVIGYGGSKQDVANDLADATLAALNAKLLFNPRALRAPTG